MTEGRRVQALRARMREGIPEQQWPELDAATEKLTVYSTAVIGDTFEQAFSPLLDALSRGLQRLVRAARG